ncbi:hypothetical protein DSO57_1008709 [Entomophthora muscae]|uniref:Uncharacterized protein n=1 Tax=Entomophthora muscae TaxID=34485 RepID=A0ACC2SW32_9FUNG|nr:hypothetical protein DSO57_1008709 [Entomophthora muscae]
MTNPSSRSLATIQDTLGDWWTGTPQVHCAIKLQAYGYKIIHQAGEAHQNVDCCSRLPAVALVSPMADIIYEKLMEDPSLWGEELVEIQRALNKLAVNTKVSKGQLLKLCGDSWLHYICHPYTWTWW